MNLPERFGIEYVDEGGQRKRPVMLHRALFGSLERFTGILLEHHYGKLPAWLSPVQVVVCSISQQHADYARDVAKLLRSVGLRAEADTRSEKIGYKIREQTLERVPFLLIAGAKEEKEGTIAIRNRDGMDLGILNLRAATAWLQQETEAPDMSTRNQELKAIYDRIEASKTTQPA